jgi:hypothetical protein
MGEWNTKEQFLRLLPPRRRTCLIITHTHKRDGASAQAHLKQTALIPEMVQDGPYLLLKIQIPLFEHTRIIRKSVRQFAREEACARLVLRTMQEQN